MIAISYSLFSPILNTDPLFQQNSLPSPMCHSKFFSISLCEVLFSTGIILGMLELFQHCETLFDTYSVDYI